MKAVALYLILSLGALWAQNKTENDQPYFCKPGKTTAVWKFLDYKKLFHATEIKNADDDCAFQNKIFECVVGTNRDKSCERLLTPQELASAKTNKPGPAATRNDTTVAKK